MQLAARCDSTPVARFRHQELFMHTANPATPRLSAERHHPAALRAQHHFLKLMFGCLMFIAALVSIPTSHAATTAEAPDHAVVTQLLDAMAANDYQRFVGMGTPSFAGISQAQFKQVADSVAPRLQQGYTVEHLGNLRQQGLDISVWKVSFKDQGDDLLATLNVTDGRVGGFFLR